MPSCLLVGVLRGAVMFSFCGIQVGKGCVPVVIPEIGINHNGSLQIAMEMVDAAAAAGARLIKHQTHVVDDEMSVEARSIKPGNAEVSIYEVMKAAALSFEEERDLKAYVEEKGLAFLSTPFSRAAADRLECLGVSAYKIGSGELNNYPLIEYISNFGKPMIISTGMNTIAQIEKAVDILERKNISYALLHTTNIYPTPPHLVRLGGMLALKKVFPDVPVGLSDHTTNNNASIAALALGASMVERHFTDRMDRIGPDICCSMDQEALRELLQAASEVPLMVGGEKGPVPEEQVTMDFAFASVVTIRPVKKGEAFTQENVWVKRPGTGEIPAEYYPEVLQSIAAVDIPTDAQLTRNMMVR